MCWRMGSLVTITSYILLILLLATAVYAPPPRPKGAKGPGSKTPIKSTQATLKKDVGSMSKLQYATQQGKLIVSHAKLGLKSVYENRPRLGKSDGYKEHISTNRVKGYNREMKNLEKQYSQNTAARAKAQSSSSKPSSKL